MLLGREGQGAPRIRPTRCWRIMRDMGYSQHNLPAVARWIRYERHSEYSFGLSSLQAEFFEDGCHSVCQWLVLKGSVGRYGGNKEVCRSCGMFWWGSLMQRRSMCQPWEKADNIVKNIHYLTLADRSSEKMNSESFIIKPHWNSAAYSVTWVPITRCGGPPTPRYKPPPYPMPNPYRPETLWHNDLVSYGMRDTRSGTLYDQNSSRWACKRWQNS